MKRRTVTSWVFINGEWHPVGGVVRTSWTYWGKLLIIKMGRLSLAFTFVFLSLYLLAPFLGAMLDAADHVARLAYIDYLRASVLLTVLGYIGFLVFRVATEPVDRQQYIEVEE